MGVLSRLAQHGTCQHPDAQAGSVLGCSVWPAPSDLSGSSGPRRHTTVLVDAFALPLCSPQGLEAPPAMRGLLFPSKLLAKVPSVFERPL